jgi:hypothetical protein
MIIKAILKINPQAKVSVVGSDINTCEIEWLEGTTPISKTDIETKINELQAEYDVSAYARARANAYPSLQEFAEAYTEKEIGGDSTKWDAYKTAYNKVRTDNPKE